MGYPQQEPQQENLAARHKVYTLQWHPRKVKRIQHDTMYTVSMECRVPLGHLGDFMAAPHSASYSVDITNSDESTSPVVELATPDPAVTEDTTSGKDIASSLAVPSGGPSGESSSVDSAEEAPLNELFDEWNARWESKFARDWAPRDKAVDSLEGESTVNDMVGDDVVNEDTTSDEDTVDAPFLRKVWWSKAFAILNSDLPQVNGDADLYDGESATNSSNDAVEDGDEIQADLVAQRKVFSKVCRDQTESVDPNLRERCSDKAAGALSYAETLALWKRWKELDSVETTDDVDRIQVDIVAQRKISSTDRRDQKESVDRNLRDAEFIHDFIRKLRAITGEDSGCWE